MLSKNLRSDTFAFTVLEVLIAITLSLLLMLSLTRAFKYLADRIKENRVQVELSNRLRSVNQIIQDDLKKMTVLMGSDHQKGATQGYFVYYEGPCTDTTSVMLGAQGVQLPDGVYFQESRFGDVDDYIAFTAHSPDVPFRGIVPKYLLLEKQDETEDSSTNSYNVSNLTPAQIQEAQEPVVIYSNYAEIIYWLQPEYATVSDTDGLGSQGLSYQYDGLGSPAINYLDNSGFPRKLVLHRRVLLIRPDLNLQPVPASAAAGGLTAAGTLPKLPVPTSAGTYVFMDPDPWAGETGGNILPQVIRGGQLNRTWQIGMTPVHQQCDLSVRWVLDANGLPTNRVAANSLEDLSVPHNRFAHVRAPSSVVGFTNPSLNGFTTMPILAVGSEMEYIRRALGNDANGNTTTVATFYPSLQTSPSVGSALNGFLRPEFALGMDLTHTEIPGFYWGRERLGEDVLANSLLGFDGQIFDRLAMVALHSGADGGIGIGGNTSLGSPNSDDFVVDANDPLFFEVMRNATVQEESRGAFVDLAYERLAGGVVRDFDLPLKPFVSSTSELPRVPANTRRLKLNTQYSLAREVVGGTAGSMQIPDSFLRSGKIIRDGTGVHLFQPTYDTYTSRYEYDGLTQRDISGLAPPTRLGTVWWNPHSSLTATTDLATNGLDDLGSIVGTDDPSERETMPPFEAPLTQIRIRLRIADEASGAIGQQAVISDLAL